MRVSKPNRRKSRAPSKRKFWCGCDRSQVGHSGKCPHCKASYKGLRDKKQGPVIDLGD